MSTVEEREMPLIQRGIVDNCFEEGHYEYGIGVLDRLRANRYKPFPLHVRQLVFIALYPPPPEPPKRVNRTDAPPPSPQKVQLQRQKDDLWPKPASRPLSIALLNAFVNTNTPESLMRGLPHYRYLNNVGALDVDPFRGDTPTDDGFEDNSPLKNEILAMQQHKDCWGLLRDGLVKRRQVDRYRDDDAELRTDDVVGRYAWPVLEWLILVFEKEESQARGQEKASHSALLLCQIPSPRSKKGPRWDAEMPLRVAFTCFLSDHQEPLRLHKCASSEKRFDLGTRLILLLVNLTLTKPPLLSPSHFLRSLVQRLPELPVEPLEALLVMIPWSHASFKIALLEGYISQENETVPDKSRPTKITTASAPRAKPKFTGKGAVIPEATPTATSSSSQDRDKDPYPMPASDHLLKTLACPLPSLATSYNSDPTAMPTPVSSAAKVAFAKMQMVSALWTLRISHRLVDTDSRWTTAVREGRLRMAIQTGFTLCGAAVGVDIGDVKGYLSQALEEVSLWEACEG